MKTILLSTIITMGLVNFSHAMENYLRENYVGDEQTIQRKLKILESEQKELEAIRVQVKAHQAEIEANQPFIFTIDTTDGKQERWEASNPRVFERGKEFSFAELINLDMALAKLDVVGERCKYLQFAQRGGTCFTLNLKEITN